MYREILDLGRLSSTDDDEKNDDSRTARNDSLGGVSANITSTNVNGSTGHSSQLDDSPHSVDMPLEISR